MLPITRSFPKKLMPGVPYNHIISHDLPMFRFTAIKMYLFSVSRICIPATILDVMGYGKIASDFYRISQVQLNL